ncbi:hypothetical protein AB0M95_28780 [Sphaerisporangium sp. NPDC051017]|uniref:hypothetical protein n=1 Tax=Sphaerisporangium sp. NPDC051017 TaxID=3154636 RepID=UPI00341B8E72
MELSPDEAPLKEPFWNIDLVSEGEVVMRVLRQRFPETIAILEEALEEADPFDIVYPDNPHEYSDVVAEMIVLMAPVNGALHLLSTDEIEALVREGLARRFGEHPDETRVKRAVRLIANRYSREAETDPPTQKLR